MKPTRSHLVHLLIGKSIFEVLLVGTIAVGIWVKSFPPTFHGWGEAVLETRSIAGWAVNDAAPWARVEVQLFIDGTFQGTQAAQVSRKDLVTTGWAKDEWHGYNFALTDLTPGNHEARVYALHRSGSRFTLQLLGDPISFDVRPDGTWKHR